MQHATRRVMTRPGAIMRTAAALVLATGLAATAEAQHSAARHADLSLGSGWGALWDDETNLGRGAPVAGGVSVTFGQRLRVGADVDWTKHVRDSGYLRADGDLVGVFARATLLFGDQASPVRPMFGAGVGALRSTGLFTVRTIVAGPAGFPVPGPDEQQSWSLTRAAWDLHTGVRIALRDGIALRPEARWRSTFGSGAAAGLEPPLLGVQAMVHLDIGL